MSLISTIRQILPCHALPVYTGCTNPIKTRQLGCGRHGIAGSCPGRSLEDFGLLAEIEDLAGVVVHDGVGEFDRIG